MKIRQMIILLFIFLAVIPMTLFGIGGMEYNNIKLENVLENDLKNAVSTQVKAMENFFLERTMDAQVILQNQMVRRLLKAKNNGEWGYSNSLRPSVENLLGVRIDNNQFVESVTLVSPDFSVAACSEPVEENQSSELKKLDPKYFNKELTFSNVIETKREGSRHKIVVGVQEIYEEEVLLGYIVIEINLEFFEEVRLSASLFNNGTIYILDGRGNMIAAGDTVSSRNTFELSATEREDFNRAWEGRDPDIQIGTLKYKARGEQYISCYYQKFGGTDWQIISSINSDEVLQTKQGYIDLILVIIFVLAVLLFALQIFMSRNIAKPMEDMIAKFEIVRKTQNYSIRMEDMKKNELGIIAGEINALLSNIESYLAMERQEQERLKAKAERDPLTGLFNKDTMEQLFRIELEQMWIEKRPIACIFVDVDDFKTFNTVHGHIGGDRVLRFIAENLEKYIHGPVGRQGGDEFVAFVSGEKDVGNIEDVVEELLNTLNEGCEIVDGEGKIPIHCSIGIAKSGDDKLTLEKLIQEADAAMYQIKRKTKNGYYVWTHSPATGK